MERNGWLDDRERGMDEWMGERWVGRWMNDREKVGGWMEREGRMERDGWVVGQMHREKHKCVCLFISYSYF